MSQAEELLDSLPEEDYMAGSGDEERHIVIGRDRIAIVPEELKKIGVQYDHNIETVTFDCPRYWDGHDMSLMKVYVNYVLSDLTPGRAIASDPVVDENDDQIMHFAWTISKNVTKVAGIFAFQVCINTVDEAGFEVNHWNSEPNNDMYIVKGLDCPTGSDDDQPEGPLKDVITELLIRIDKCKSGLDAVDDKLEKELDDDVLIIDITITQEDINNGTNVVDLSQLHYLKDASVDWGDGEIVKIDGSVDDKHAYKAGTYRIKVYNVAMDFDNALFGLTAATYIKVPKSVTAMGMQAFRSCSNLKKVDLPEGLESISRSAFYLCQSLEYIEIPSTVNYIDRNAFYRCEAMRSATFKNVSPIAYNSTWFEKCNSLTKVFVPNEALDAYKEAWTAETRLDSIAYISNVPPSMNFIYKELVANAKYTIKRNGYYMIYSNSANLTLAKKDGTVVVEGAKQMQFMTPPVEGGSNIKACGMYWTGSSLGGVEGFRRSTNDGGYVTAPTEFYVAEMVKE